MSEQNIKDNVSSDFKSEVTDTDTEGCADQQTAIAECLRAKTDTKMNSASSYDGPQLSTIDASRFVASKRSPHETSNHASDTTVNDLSDAMKENYLTDGPTDKTQRARKNDVAASAAAAATAAPSSSSYHTAFDVIETSQNNSLDDDVDKKKQKLHVFNMYVQCTCTSSRVGNAIKNEIVSVRYEPSQNVSNRNGGRNTDSASSGYAADNSTKVSPSSSIGFVQPFSLQPSVLNRTSYASHTSGSSMSSSAASLHNAKLRTNDAKQDVKLTVQRYEELKSRWGDTIQLYRLLDYIDVEMQRQTTMPQTNGVRKLVADDNDADLNDATSVATKKLRNNKRQSQTKNQTTDSEATPKKKIKPTTDDAAQGDGTETFSFTCGSEVFAKWTDRRYYAARLVKMVDNKWTVRFYDGGERRMFEDQLIPSSSNTLLGQRLYACDTIEGDYMHGIVTDTLTNNGVLIYMVCTDSGDYLVPSKNLYFTEAQGRLIRKNLKINIIVSSSSDTSSTRRTRRTRSSFTVPDSPRPCTSGLQKQLVHKPVDSDDECSDSNSSSDLAIFSIYGCERELPLIHSIYRCNQPMKLKNVCGKLPRTDDGVDASIVGPIPIGNWFKNLHFLLNCTDGERRMGKRVPVNYNSSSSTDQGISTDQEDLEFTNIPFIEDRLRLQLINGSGKVYKRFEDLPAQCYKQTYLIANRPNLTPCYQLCIAAGIKVLNHEWVIRCCQQKKCLPLQELPIGYSIELSKFLCSYNKKAFQPLRGSKIYIAQLSDKRFYDFWSKVITLAGGSVERFTDKSKLEHTTCIVVEPFIRDPALDIAQARNVPLVSTMWITQSLIHGETRPVDNHIKYNYLFEDSDD